MNDYELRKAERIDRYRERAERARAESTSLLNQAHKMADVIPFGQPILVGHYSEKRDRNYRTRIENKFRKAFETHKSVAYWEERAAAAEKNNAVYRGDPDAVAKLQEKVAALEAEQTRMKAVNAAHKRFLKDPGTLDRSGLSDADKALVRAYKPAYSWEPHPYPPYALTNNNANIRRVKERIAELAKEPAPAAAPIEGPGGAVVSDNVERDSIEISFPAKPATEVLAKLKANGWRWARMSKVWYKRRTDWARQVAAEIVAMAAGGGT